MIGEASWERIGTPEPEALRDAALELHWAAQVIAAAGQTFVESRSDDSHRTATWSAKLAALVGEPFSDGYPFRVGIRPQDLTLFLVDGADEALGSLPLAGHTLSDARSWLSVGLATYMGAGAPKLETPEYDLPEHEVGSGEPFRGGLDDERRALHELYGGADAMLRLLVSSRDDASAIRCWPHHFDIATLLTVGEQPDGSATTVGVGLAPMGGGYDGWYWYVTPYPYPETSTLPELEGPGSWHTEGWTGAVLTAETLMASPADFREAAVRKFLDVSVEAATTALDA